MSPILLHHHHHHHIRRHKSLLCSVHQHNSSVYLRVKCTSTSHQPINPLQMGLEPTLTTKVITKAPKPTDLSLKSTWAHRAWLVGGCTTLAISLAKSVTGTITSHALLVRTLASLLGYILADLGSGVVHWGLDNYGSDSNSLFSAEIDAFQGHHRWPWAIAKRQIANNLHTLACAIIFTVLPINLVCNDPAIHMFVSVFAGCIMFSQQFHAWAHGTKSKLPRIVVALQELGILISRSKHSVHHQSPYNKGYCVVSGVWNEFLDRNKVFEAMEKMLFFRFGIRPRSWSESSPREIIDATLISTPCN